MVFKVTQDKMREMALGWIQDEGDIIELGCSNGNFAELLFKKNILNYCGIDILNDKINEAKRRLLKMKFIRCDITKHLYLLSDAKTFVSFQCLEHIENDLDILKSLTPKANVIISVPNSPYKGHVRWFELDGWKNRYSPLIDFENEITIQNPNKPAKRSFLFKGIKK